MCWVVVAFVMSVAFVPREAVAARVHGVVLAVTPASGVVVVRRDDGGAGSGSTASYRIVPRARAAQLPIGSVIDAQLEPRASTLGDVVVESVEPLTTAGPVSAGTPLRVGDLLPDLQLVDRDGRPFRLAQLRGRSLDLAFFTTRSAQPQLGPRIAEEFATLEREPGPHLVEISLDPSYDRPPVLARYGQAYGADPTRWTLAVGPRSETWPLAERLGLVVAPDPTGDVLRNERLIEVGPDGRIRALHSLPTRPPRLPTLAPLVLAAAAVVYGLVRVGRWFRSSCWFRSS